MPTERPIVRLARKNEKQWLYENQHLFQVGYPLAPSGLRKEWPCFVISKNGRILGFHSLEFHETNGENHAWVGHASVASGLEGKGLGSLLVKHANTQLLKKGFAAIHVYANEPTAKKLGKAMVSNN